MCFVLKYAHRLVPSPASSPHAPLQHNLVDPATGRSMGEPGTTKKFEEKQGKLEIGASGELGPSLSWWGIKETKFDKLDGEGGPAGR